MISLILRTIHQNSQIVVICESVWVEKYYDYMVTSNQAMKKYKYVTVSACHNIDLIANVGTIMIKKAVTMPS